jgi:hypothetical protein
LQNITSLAFDAYAVTDSKLTALLLVVESVVLTILVTGIVIQAHAAEIVVLVESLNPVLYRDAILHSYVVNCALATKLEAVAVAIVGIVSKRNMTWLTVVICDVNAIAFELVEPLLVSLIARMLANIVLLRTIAVADAILDNCATIISGRVCVEVPAVIRVVPCTTAAIGISTTIILLVGETVSVTTEVGCINTFKFIVEVIVRVTVEDKVAVTVLHLDTCIAIAIDVKILEDAVRTDVEESVLAGIANCETFHINVIRLYHDTALSIFLLAEVKDRLFVLISHDNGVVALKSVLVLDMDGVFQVILTSAAIQSIGA